MFTLAGTTSACRKEAEPVDSTPIVRAYEEWLESEPKHRAETLQRLREAPCPAPSLCADRDACVRYAAALNEAQDLAERARRLGPEQTGGSGAATKEELAVILGAASTATSAAEESVPFCEAALTRLYAALPSRRRGH